LARVTWLDPVEGGSCNDYEYVCGDPVNNLDLDGDRCWTGVARTEKVWDAEGKRWKTKEHCNSVSRGVARHKVGIIKGAGYTAFGASLIAAPFSGGTSTAFGVAALGLATTAEAVDRKPCRAERVVLTATLGWFAGSVGGAFASGGWAAAGGGASASGYATDVIPISC
jgi:hypothetical protein